MSRLLETVAPGRLGVGFRWLVASSWVSNLGDGNALAAGPLLVASQTRDPLLVAMAVLLQQLPWLLFGLQAGAIADRLDRRPIVVTVDLARSVVLVLLCVFPVLNWPQLRHIAHGVGAHDDGALVPPVES